MSNPHYVLSYLEKGFSIFSNTEAKTQNLEGNWGCYVRMK